MKLHISERGLSTPESPIRKLAPFAEQAREKGVKVYHLNIGQPDIQTPQEFYKAVKNFNESVLAYGPSNGLNEFRNILRSYYHRNGFPSIECRDIMVTTAGSEAILFSMMAVASPGEEIMIFEPFYPNYNGFSKMAGIKLIPVNTDPETGYHLPDMKLIESKITPRTKAILICSPNNPTGTVYGKNEMQMIRDIALKHNLFVLSDEVYREFVFDGEYTGILSFPELSQNAIVMDSLSKRYSACGARVGCIVSKNSEILDTVLKFGQARLCPPTLEQVASMELVQHGDQYFPNMLAEYKKRRDATYMLLSDIPGVQCKKPEGAFYLMVTLPVDDIEPFSRWLLTDFNIDGETTMMAPGPGFYATSGRGRHEARIAYVLNTQDIEKAIFIVKEGLARYNRSE